MQLATDLVLGARCSWPVQVPLATDLVLGVPGQCKCNLLLTSDFAPMHWSCPSSQLPTAATGRQITPVSPFFLSNEKFAVISNGSIKFKFKGEGVM